MKNIYSNIANTFPTNVFSHFNYASVATNAVGYLSEALNEIYNFIEPGFYDGHIFVVKNLTDEVILPKETSESIHINKARLFDCKGDIVIQLFENKEILLWENENIDHIFKDNRNITYHYHSSKEEIILSDKVFDITSGSFGSRFSDEFNELETQLNNYKLHKAKYSSCPILNDSWTSNKRIFFKAGGKDIPEVYLQKSLHNFIKDLQIFKGDVGQFDPTREHILGASKPVDIIVRWEKSNRIALIEIKWLGKSLHDGQIKSNHNNSRANEGFKQLKEYFDLAKQDNPNKIIKCYLVVIDARRWNTNEHTVSISHLNGMHYKNTEITIDEDKNYHQTYKNIHAPIRMFVEPICD